MTAVYDLNESWHFRQLNAPLSDWTQVRLPHSPFVSDLDGRNHWFGECEYRRAIDAPSAAAETRFVLFIGAAMHTARIFVDDHEQSHHIGGYLPFEIDLTDALRSTGHCHVTLRLDNRDQPDVPPGKAFEELDFCWYGGLYRNAELRLKPPLHITDAVAADEVGGGGVFLRTLTAAPGNAVMAIKTHVRNTGAAATVVRTLVSLRLGTAEVATTTSEPVNIPAGEALHVALELAIQRPQLWSPEHPVLHDAIVTLVAPDGSVIDRRCERVGLRRIAFSRSGGFTINDRRYRLRGTNRHQEYPRVGYAAPRGAQYRDAVRIKEAGFDYVRLSHYPQSPDFLAACDELGIVVMNCIPGWQFIGGPRFRERCYQAARQLIRRDRNHPSVVLWELSLNETQMDEAFMATLHAIGHEEYPGDQMFTCGWIDRYDVFTHSRQHGEIHRWHNGDKALVIAEYGDWEFFARNEGFDQKSGAGVFDRWSTARQRRADGERALRQQVINHIIALSDTLASPAVLDGQWAAFDYARGYDPARAAVGVMDIFRLPKFSYYFYRSQRHPAEHGTGWVVGPVVYIASHWIPASELRIQVFSNCEEVELRLNDEFVGRQRPAQTALTQHLPHPPFYFQLPRFTAGRLEAIGFIDGKPQATHQVATPAAPSQLELIVDDAGMVTDVTESDVLFAHARWCDASGTLCIEEESPITFAIDGAEIVGGLQVSAEAGIASVVVRIPPGSARFTLRVVAGAIQSRELCWQRVVDGSTAISPPETSLVAR